MFFFKQKTAYEMRISDWSSDVCSSDLASADIVPDVVGDDGGVARIVLGDSRLDLADQIRADISRLGEDAAAKPREDRDQRRAERERDERIDDGAVGWRMARRASQIPEEDRDREKAKARSEEHTSELQSLMRNSY